MMFSPPLLTHAMKWLTTPIYNCICAIQHYYGKEYVGMQLADSSFSFSFHFYHNRSFGFGSLIVPRPSSLLSFPLFFGGCVIHRQNPRSISFFNSSELRKDTCTYQVKVAAVTHKLLFNISGSYLFFTYQNHHEDLPRCRRLSGAIGPIKN